MYGPNYNQYSASAANYYLALSANGVGYGTGNENEQGTVASDTQTEATNSYPNQNNNITKRDSSWLSKISYPEESFRLGFDSTTYDGEVTLQPDKLSAQNPQPPEELVEKLNSLKKVKIANYNPQSRPIKVANSQQLNPRQAPSTTFSNFDGTHNPSAEAEVALSEWQDEQRRKGKNNSNNDWRISSEVATLDLMDRFDGLVRALFGDFSQSNQFA